MNRPIVIAITGGPCAGKTSAMAAIKKDLTGHNVCIVPEAATLLFAGGFHPYGADAHGTALKQAQVIAHAATKLDTAIKAFEHLKKNCLWGVEQVCDDVLKILKS